MFVLVRAVTYSTLFIGFLLVFLPARLLSWSGVPRPHAIGLAQAAGMLLTAVGAALALWCILTFVLLGKGTPAPFDAPRRLVVRGPYQFVRNPMYLGAATALAGAALFYVSAALAGYAGAFLVVTHAFVVWYEEPTLRATFGAEYEDYCRRVQRWRPRLRGGSRRTFSGPEELWRYSMDVVTRLRAEEDRGEAADLLERGVRYVTSSGWEWLGELGQAARAVEKRYKTSPEVREALQTIIRTTGSSQPYRT